jgi:hypothetical protein
MTRDPSRQETDENGWVPNPDCMEDVPVSNQTVAASSVPCAVRHCHRGKSGHF